MSDVISAKNQHKTEHKVMVFYSLVFLFVAAIIVYAACGDLWLDEIWSIAFAEAANRPLEIFLRFRHDNNHILNTLYLYTIGQQATFVYYRLFAITSGILSIALLAKLARQWGTAESFIALLLSGTSYPLVLYFSEARGYGPAIFFALLSYWALRECQPHVTFQKLLIYWVGIMLGFLSHSTFVIIFIALFCHTIAQQFYTDSTLRKKLFIICLFNIVPCLFFLFFYLFFIQSISMGGGPIYSIWEVIGKAGSLLLSFPEGILFKVCAAGFIVTIVFTSAFMLYRDSNCEWLFYLTVLLVAPVLLIVITRPAYLYFRYFIVCFPFFYLLQSYLLGKLIRMGAAKYKVLAAAFLLFTFTGHSMRIIPLLHLGRGSYMAAISYLASNTAKDIISVGSDHDFRNRMLMDFYSRFLPVGKKLSYITQENLRYFKPEWMITHSQDLAYQPAPEFFLATERYKLVNSFRYAGISGWSWFLYRKENSR